MSIKWSMRMFAAACTAIFFLVSCGQEVYASDAKALSARVSDNVMYLYVRNVSENAEVSVQTAGTVIGAEDIQTDALQDLAVPMRTVILLDTSLSIPEEERPVILEILSGLIAGRMDGEQLRIGTYSDEVCWLCDFTSDAAELTAVAEGIVYEKKSAYLGSILYELVSALKEEEGGIYTRVLVISDGADDQSIGYTSEEVSAVLSESGIPVYAVGIRLSDNSPELETLFSYSRASSAEYFLLENYTAEDLVSELQADQNSLRISVLMEETLLDGCVRNIRLQLESGDEMSVMTFSVQMPFGSLTTGTESDEETGQVSDQAPESGAGEITAEDIEADSASDSVYVRVQQMLPYAAGGAVAAAVIIAALLLRRRKRKEVKAGNGSGSGAGGPGNRRPQEKYTVQDPGYHTESDPERDEMTPAEETVYDCGEREEETVLMGTPVSAGAGSDKDYLILTNLERPELRYKCSLRDSASVGRRDTDIVIEGDPEVSRTHCRFELRGSSLYLEDCGSRNGTTYEGRKLLQGQKIRISVGGRVKIGRYTYSADLMQRR